MKELTSEDISLLQRIGAFAHFVGKRCLYLLQHPDGAPRRDLEMDDNAYETLALIEGAVIDVLARVGASDSEKAFGEWLIDDSAPTELAFKIICRTVGFQSVGALVLRQLSADPSVESDGADERLRFVFTGESIKSGLERLPRPSPGCPVIVSG